MAAEDAHVAETDPSVGPLTGTPPPVKRRGWLTSWTVWLIGLFLALAGIAVVISLPYYRRMQAMQYLDEHGAEYEFTDASEWITECFGEWAKPFRSVTSVRWNGNVTDEAFLQIASFDELREFHSRSRLNEPLTDRGLAAFRNLRRLESLTLFALSTHDREFAEYLAIQPPLREVFCTSGPHSLQAISRLQSIESLRLGSIDIADEDFKSLDEMPNLEYLSLQTIPVGHSAVEWFARSTKLHTLRITYSIIDDDDLELISRLSTLQCLSIESCPDITDVGISHLARLPHLRQIALPAEAFTHASVEMLKAISTLEYVVSVGRMDDQVLRTTIELEWDYQVSPRPVTLEERRSILVSLPMP